MLPKTVKGQFLFLWIFKMLRELNQECEGTFKIKDGNVTDINITGVALMPRFRDNDGDKRMTIYDFIKEMRITYLEAKLTITGSTEPLNDEVFEEVFEHTDYLNEELKTSEYTNDGVILNNLYIYDISENIIKNIN